MLYPEDVALNHKVIFWGRLYRASLLVLMFFTVTLAAIGVSKVFVISDQIDETTRDTQSQVQCIAQFFTQTDRQNLKIPSIDKCNITREP